MESVYEEALCYELSLRGLRACRGVAVPVVYKGQRLATELRADLPVEELVLVECKATETPHRVHELTYLRLLGLRLGLVVNFGTKTIREGSAVS